MYVCMYVVADQLVAGLDEVCKDLSDVFLVRGQVPLDEAVEAQQPIGEKSEKRYLYVCMYVYMYVCMFVCIRFEIWKYM